MNMQMQGDWSCVVCSIDIYEIETLKVRDADLLKKLLIVIIGWNPLYLDLRRKTAGG